MGGASALSLAALALYLRSLRPGPLLTMVVSCHPVLLSWWTVDLPVVPVDLPLDTDLV